MTQQKLTRSELKREAIIQGAKEAFQRYGVADTSMDKISEVAQVSKRTIYNHFASKEELVTHIIKEIWANTILSFEAPYDSSIDLKSQLIEFVQNQLSLMADPKILEFTRVVVGYCLFRPDNFKKEIAEFFKQETAMIRWIKQAMADGKLKKTNPLIANEQILSLLHGQAFWPQLLHSEPPLNDEEKKQLANQTVDMFLAYYQIS
ncbi:MAG: TetR/AcrR family transcriptional regulator [Pseudomonadota bacterium]